LATRLKANGRSGAIDPDQRLLCHHAVKAYSLIIRTRRRVMTTTDSSQPGSKTTYRFEFFRDMVNDRGMCYRCLLDTIEIDHASSVEEALASAQRIFEERHGLSAWHHLADGYETHEISQSACCCK
jgi:hypothetical protein